MTLGVLGGHVVFFLPFFDFVVVHLVVDFSTISVRNMEVRCVGAVAPAIPAALAGSFGDGTFGEVFAGCTKAK
jgi:hypothetical protein